MGWGNLPREGANVWKGTRGSCARGGYHFHRREGVHAAKGAHESTASIHRDGSILASNRTYCFFSFYSIGSVSCISGGVDVYSRDRGEKFLRA